MGGAWGGAKGGAKVGQVKRQKVCVCVWGKGRRRRW